MRIRFFFLNILLFLVSLLNLFVLYLYSSSCMDLNVVFHSIRLILNLSAMMVCFWGWNNPQRSDAALAVSLYMLGIASNLFALFARPPLVFSWHSITSAGLFLVAILLLLRVLFLINHDSPSVKTISYDLIGASLLIAASLTLSFLSERSIVVDFIFPMIVILAVSSPAIVLFAYWIRFFHFFQENSEMRSEG